MEAQPEITQNISSLKLPMLKTGDYDLWNYALWEVIINGDSPVPKPPAVGTVVPPKTEAQKLAKKNKLKAKSTLLLAILDEHLLKFHSIKDAKSLLEAIKIRYMRLRLKGKSSSSSNSYNVSFVSSENTNIINETVNAAHDIPAASSKEQPFALSYADDVAMITMRVKKFMKKTGRNLNFNGKEPVGFDKTTIECYNCHRRRHFARDFHAPRNQGNRSGDNERRVVPVETPASDLVVQDGLVGYDWSYQAEEGPTNFALMAYSSDSANSSNFKKVDLKEKLTKLEESSKNLTRLINSQVSPNDKTGLGYDSQLSENEMSKCEIFKVASDSSMSEIDEYNNQTKDRYKVEIGYHAVPPPYIGNYMPLRADLSFTGLDDFVFKFKITESARFEQIIDFLKSKPIHYALIVNPTIYVSYVKQFWATAKVKKVNDQEQIQAIVDKNKVIITEDSIRSDLHFDDAEGSVCLLNEAIFKGLTRMGAKTTAWNEFSSTMASAIICLADNKKFNFSKDEREELGSRSGEYLNPFYPLRSRTRSLLAALIARNSS
uniref:Uncharacterized protein n=1 Tax=Tanacetum cinerariifolium TaxID=118510 RepID=A0A6L2KKI0_TANCI|nr:hypothetical protein [Tanacetum cinerariifolium]